MAGVEVLDNGEFGTDAVLNGPFSTCLTQHTPAWTQHTVDWMQHTPAWTQHTVA